MEPATNTLHAYELTDAYHMPISPAPLARDWMDDSGNRFAYRCLPLAIANQAGWVIPTPVTFSACWNGGPAREDTTVTVLGATGETPVASHFGCGVVTVSIPYLFRTPPGVNLWVKGLSNWIKDGAQPLEGVVEADWLLSTFTMNWKLTRPGHPVRFERGEPVCMVVPVPRGLAEGLQPRLSSIHADRDVCALYLKWREERGAFLKALEGGEPQAVARGWQRDYMKGLRPDGATADGHQTRLKLREFVRDEPVSPGTAPPAYSAEVPAPR
jgi:hypothetical protein